MPYARLAGFVKRLREIEGTSVRCLEFLILTATLTSEALGAQWSEVDAEARTRTIPKVRMKTGKRATAKPHVVHLTECALAILEGQRGQSDKFVFPSVWRTDGTDAPMSNMALLMQMRRMKEDEYTVHGFRSAFSDWAYEHTGMRGEIIEAALAHVDPNKTKSAYLRTGFEADRAKLPANVGGIRRDRQPANELERRPVAARAGCMSAKKVVRPRAAKAWPRPISADELSGDESCCTQAEIGRGDRRRTHR